MPKGGAWGKVGGFCPVVQPFTVLCHFTILDRKGTPFEYLLLINGTLFILFIYFIYFATQNVQKKERKNTLKNKSGHETLNRKHRAYTGRLLQLQPMMATHAEKSGKDLEFWIQKSVQTLEREIELQM